MQRAAWIVGGLATAAIGALIAIALVRIAELDAHELDRAGASVRLAGETQRVFETDVLEGDELTFELCSADAMEHARWAGAMNLSLDAIDGEASEHLLDQRVDSDVLARARRGPHGACFDFFEVGPITASGHFVVSVRDVSELVGTVIRVRVMAERPLTARDRNTVLSILMLAIVLIAGLAMRSPSSAGGEAFGAWSAARAYGLAAALGLVGIALAWVQPGLPLAGRVNVTCIVAVCSGVTAVGHRRGWAGVSALAAVLALVELSALLSFVTPPGPELGLVAGLVLGAIEIGLALALARSIGASPRVTLLGLQRPERRAVAAAGFVLAPVVGVILRIAAMRALALVPSTGEAPIEAYVSWPSGLLSFAALSVIAPIGEEIFFRGLVFGALRGQGGASRETLAFAGAWLLFVVAHLPQTWGSWGGLLAIAIAGLGFTALRASTGSVLVSALAHLVYNGLLAAAALAAA